jgi:DNA-binding response OmpR family regulator
VHVLVVEDDGAIAEPLVAGLEGAGLTVTHVGGGAAALDHVAAADIVLLDLGLPDMDGLDVCRAIRARSAVPLIVVTARGEEADRVVGLELGADDYVVKPFGIRELVARIRAVVRRASGDVSERPQEIGPLRIDRRARRVFVDGVEVALTPKEFDVLAVLAEEPGVVVRRREILDAAWGGSWFGPTKTLDVHVAAIRRKLGDPAWIETVRSVGFRLGRPA